MLPAASARAQKWVTGYYPGYRQLYGMPASAIDFSALTDVVHFSLTPNPDGSLNLTQSSLTTNGVSDLVTRAHAAGKKALICVGGAGTQSAFQAATTDANLGTFVSNIVSFATNWNYDGVDVDWEPLDDSDSTNFPKFIRALRAALGTGTLLTAATASEPGYFATLQSQFDQINVMTYDMLSVSEGWVTWFNAPIFDGGYRFASTGNLVPSADGLLKSFAAAGVVSNKMSIGIAFYGYIEQGGTGTTSGGATVPRQAWNTPPSLNTFTYDDIIATYYQSNFYHWDASAQTPYLSITNVSPANDMFITYDDERSCQAKVSYARNHGLGGVMIWELGQDHQSGRPDPLLQAVKQAMATPGPVDFARNGNDMDLQFSGIALGQYSVRWTDNLNSPIWNVLLNTNVPGAAKSILVTDTGAVTNQTVRFYRVQTPP
jgi:chitinase